MKNLAELTLDIISKYEPKVWWKYEDNYFIVFDTYRQEFVYCTVSGGYYDPLRKYFDKEIAKLICDELNIEIKQD